MSFNEGITIDTSSGSRGGGGRGRGPMMVGGGVGTLVIVLIAMFLGVNPDDLVGGAQQQPQQQQTQAAGDLAELCRTGADANEHPECRIAATENSLDAYWQQALGPRYQRPRYVIFTGSVNTGCGHATSQVGPFYCPVDQTMYYDVAFFDVLGTQFGSSTGPLAQEYIVAHEFGHHVQQLLGVLNYAQQDPQGPESGAVRVELMADCFGGVWAHHAANTVDEDTGQTYLKPLTEQDIRDALSAASAVGDDRIQEKVQGRVNPEAWTHGSSAQRQYWFTVGYQSGEPNRCDTLNARDLG